MDWFNGSIGEAIQSAKLSKAIFVVVVHGADDDEASSKFFDVLQDNEVNSRLQRPKAVCIKVQNGTQACTQFSQIYPVILVPSIYFIDSSTGVNVEVTGGNVSKEKIIQSIDKAMSGQMEASIASPRNERVEQARRTLQEEAGTNSSDEPTTPTTSLTLEERVERAKRLLAEKQALKNKEALEKEKDSEKDRREMGKNVAALKKKQEDDEIRQAAEERQREKEEQRMALLKIKEQIAQDRADRAVKFNAEKAEREEKRKEIEKQRLAEEARKAELLLAERSTVARVQFRLPNGTTKVSKFEPENTIADLYNFVVNDMQTPYGSNISLSTTFPSRELDNEPKEKTLRDAGLVPSVTILILPKGGRGSSVTKAGPAGGIIDYVWLLLTPITIIWGVISSFIFGAQNQNQEQNRENRKRQGDASSDQGRQSGAYKRRSTGIRTQGNIARLSNDDSDDETNTYNGNSTQQM